MAGRRPRRDNRRSNTQDRDPLENWTPRTELGKQVQSGEVTSINQILESGLRILEPAIVTKLVPDLGEQIILVGQSPGKGGGGRRTVAKKTTRMHKSGRRFSNKTMIIVGNRNGLIGFGESDAKETRDALKKASNQARINILRIRRGSGSWESGTPSSTSIPFKVRGKSGSTRIELIPAPRGTGLAVSDEVKKIMELAGIQDIWIRKIGTVKSRENLIKAVFDALRNLNRVKVDEKIIETTGLVKGVI